MERQGDMKAIPGGCLFSPCSRIALLSIQLLKHNEVSQRTDLLGFKLMYNHPNLGLFIFRSEKRVESLILHFSKSYQTESPF